MIPDYTLFTGKLDEIDLSKKQVINTINQYSFCIAEEDALFKQALQQSDILLPDGVGITFYYRLMCGQKIQKIAGADLHHFLLTKLNQTGGSCFYLGSSDKTLRLIQARMQVDFPNIRTGSFSPPYKAVFTVEENQEMIRQVNAFKPDVLFIGMTAPKQEKWLHEHKTELEAKSIGSIGAVFDFYAGTVERPGKIWIKLKLEWLIRLIKEPKRMWRRYLYYGPVFIFQILKNKITRK